MSTISGNQSASLDHVVPKHDNWHALLEGAAVDEAVSLLLVVASSIVYFCFFV